MKTKFNEFVNESRKNSLALPIRDEKYQFLIDVCKKTEFEQTCHFYVKELIEIGTCGSHKMYLNYLDKDDYQDNLSFWFVYNEREDDLTGTKWESGVLYEENGELISTDKHDEITLYPNYMDIIYDTIKSYPDLDKWCKNIKKIGETNRKYHRWAIQDSYKNKEDRKELTWEQQIDRIKTHIELDKLLNRYSEPYDERRLAEMLKLGEIEYTKLENERNERMMRILNKNKNK